MPYWKLQFITNLDEDMLRQFDALQRHLVAASVNADHIDTSVLVLVVSN